MIIINNEVCGHNSEELKGRKHIKVYGCDVLDNMFGRWCGGDGVVVVWQGLDLPCDLLSHLVLTLTT